MTATNAPMHIFDRLYIGGEWVKPATERVFTPISPSTGEVVGQVPEAVNADVDRAVEAARWAFDDPDGWSHWTASQRANVMERFADLLEARADETTRMVSIQNGMPIALANNVEGVFPAAGLRYYAGLIREQGLEERREGVFGRPTIVIREPVGVVASITPWNFPQGLSFVKIAPALAAGCTVVAKASPETVLDSFVVAEIAHQAGFPPGVINFLPADREAGAYLVGHPNIDKVAFTGSTAAGRQIGEVCGRLLRPVTLELGGKSAAIVLDDADLKTHATEFVDATLQNNGQTCYLQTRILVPNSKYDEFVSTITDIVSNLTIGDPLDSTTQVGPMVSEQHRERVESYIATGVAEGGRITTGGGRPNGLESGFYVEPTVFADVSNDDTIAREEIFGPVLAVIGYDTVDDAIVLANDSEFGLGGSVWSGDETRAVEISRQIKTGGVGINYYGVDIGSPFGGVKASGLGREQGPEGLAAYQVSKTIYNAPAL